MKVYQERFKQYHQHFLSLKKLERTISYSRLIVAIICAVLFYYYTQTSSIFILLAGILCIVAFIVLLRYHQRTEWKRKLTKKLSEINKEELNAVDKGTLSFSTGTEFIDPHHSYSYDLDIFGEHSLFQFLNRTGTLKGKTQLASMLSTLIPNEEILSNQTAIKELSEAIDLRQKILALAKIHPDSEKSHQVLFDWVDKNKKPPLVIKFIAYLTPSLIIGSVISSLFISNDLIVNLAWLLALVNLAILGTCSKSALSEVKTSTEVGKVLIQYGKTLNEIENKTFKSQKLIALQKILLSKKGNASPQIAQLSKLFEQMDHIKNIFASPILNGLLLFHIHILFKLNRWKAENGHHIADWLQVIAEFEALNSLANFSYNHPDYAFPLLNETNKISFNELGHPLIRAEKRIANSVSFQPHRFFILTGSNMSGKSTFLRTLGINMVLASIGAPVCASEADIHPLPVLVSMRLSDSLSDSESYFFAEVKRLKEIMEKLDQKTCFILLDEILKGTNSDDKQAGTIAVIKKMAQKGAIGAIATHDLEVCKTSEEYKDILVNKRFEVEIINNELVFDYKLKDGICQNKSATFLMKKMGVI